MNYVEKSHVFNTKLKMSACAAAAACVPAFKKQGIAMEGEACVPLSLGTYKLSPDEAEAACRLALECGLVAFDTAALYKTESAVGAVCREAAFKPHVTTKVHPRHHGTARATACIERSCAALPHIDVLMLHRPAAWGPPEAEHDRLLRETWAAMESAVDSGRVATLGVSNVSAAQLEDLMSWVRIKPVVLQVEFHPLGKPSAELLSVAARHGIRIQAYSPFGGDDGSTILANPRVVEIAAAAGCTPAQAVISWLVHHHGVHVAFRATKKDYIMQAVTAVDSGCGMTVADYAALDALDEGLVTCGKRASARGAPTT